MNTNKNTLSIVATIVALFATIFVPRSFAVTVTYTMLTTNFNSLLTEKNNNPPYAGTFSNTPTEIGQYANNGSFNNTPGAAAFQTFTTTGNGNTGTVRALQVGDTFTITGYTSANPSSGGYIGISFRDSTTYSSFFSSTDAATEARFQLDSSGNWKVYNNGTAVDSGLGAASDRTFTIKITSANTFNATVGGTTYYDLAMAGGGGSIDSFAIYTFGDSNQNSFWKNGSLADTGTVEFGNGAGNGVTRTISGIIANGLAANSTSTAVNNAVTVSGDAGSQINFTAANTYSGATTVSANATLEVQNSSALGSTAAGTTVNSGGTLKIWSGSTLTTASEALTLNGAGVSSGGALRNAGGNNTYSGAVTLGSASRINSDTGTLTLDVASGSAVSGSFGLTIGGAGNVTVNDNVGIGGSNLAKDGAGVLTLNAVNNYTGETQINQGTLAIGSSGGLATQSVVYVGNGGNAFDATLQLTGTAGVANNIQINTSSGSGTRSLIKADATSQSISGNITNNRSLALNVTNAGGSLNLSGALSGAATLFKSGAGTLVLSGSSDNSLTGVITVAGGTLVLNKSSGDAVDSALIINSGAVLTNSAANQINDGDGVFINDGGTWALGGNNETVNNLTVSGSLALGTAQVIVNGSSSLWSGTVSGASGSSLVFKADTTDIGGNNTGLASGSSIYVVGGVVGLNHDNAAGSSTIYLGETFGANSATLDSGVSGTTIGNNVVVRTGSTGTKTIDNATGTGSRAISFNGGVDLQDTVFINSSASENITFGGVISNSGSIVKQGAGTMTLGAANTMSGGVYVDDGTLAVATGADLTAASNVTIGTTNFTSDAVLQLASGAAGLDRTINVASGAGTRTLSSAGNNAVSGAINQSGNLTVSSSSGTLSVDDVTMNTSGNNDLAVGGAGNVNIGGTITAGSGASSIDKSGAGTLTISGDNSGQSYMLNIGGGKVVLDSANALGTSFSDKVNFTANSTLNAAANISPASLGLRVANGVTGTIEVNSGNNLSAATLGSVSGTGTFNKSGTGTLTLTGTSTVANANNVNAGTLAVSSGAALAGTTTVNDGGTLSGSGSVGATTIASGGTISPGNSPGTLSLTNGLTWSVGGNYNWQIYNATGTAGASNGWDLLAVSGSAWNISGLTAGSFNINLWSLSGSNPDVNGNAINFDNGTSYTWELLTYTSLTGSFDANLFNLNVAANNGTSGFSNPLNSGVFSLAVDGNSLNLLFTPGGGPGPSPVPEPGTWAAAAMLAGAAGYMRWRRRKQVEPKA